MTETNGNGYRNGRAPSNWLAVVVTAFLTLPTGIGVAMWTQHASTQQANEATEMHDLQSLKDRVSALELQAANTIAVQKSNTQQIASNNQLYLTLHDQVMGFGFQMEEVKKSIDAVLATVLPKNRRP